VLSGGTLGAVEGQTKARPLGSSIIAQSAEIAYREES
jgi:hypothetical protein